jgi:hypothetical protein
MSAAFMTFFLTSTLQKLCAATSRCGCSGVHVIVDLRTNGLRDVGARGPAIAIAQRMVFVRDQVVVNQCSVQRTARRDHTPPFFVLADFFFADLFESSSVREKLSARDVPDLN